MTLALRPAAPADLPACRALLLRSRLPLRGLERDFPGGFVVADIDAALVGCAGVERHDDAGLLRSVGVSEHLRGQGIGERLVHDRVAHARARGLTSLWLLTTTVPAFFTRLGFHAADRASAPQAVRQSEEFMHLCPDSAHCLVLRLGTP